MDSRFKSTTAALGLLTAIVVLFGAITDQGWLPSFVKGPTQDVLPGQQPGELGGGGDSDGETGGSATGNASSSPSIDIPPTEPTAAPPIVRPDTCVQGYVWREAIADDHVCVTPQMRDQVQEDNRLADSRRSPTGGDYGPDTCVQGYVWREVIADDHVCVTPQMRDQVQEDNRLADGRRVD